MDLVEIASTILNNYLETHFLALLGLLAIGLVILDMDIEPITRALLVHLEFVTIHPFMDGNGRLGRLLMNYALLVAGLPWITIRSDERIPFFRAIEMAQVDNDAEPFIEFVWHLISHSIKELKPAAVRAIRLRKVSRKHRRRRN